MPLTILHSTAPDGTFSATGAQAWTAAHTVSGSISEADLSLSDTTTGNVSATAHGFAPKFPNNTTTFLRGDGTYAAPSGGSASPTFPGGIPLTGVSYPRIWGNGLNTGDNDLYTVPSGKRVAVMGLQVYNSSAGNISYYLEVKISSTYYRLASTTTPGTLQTSTNITTLSTYIFEPGEVIAVNTATNNGANIYLRAIQFDNTCAVFSAKKLSSWAASDNTIYTCPSATTAFLIDASMGFNTAGQGNLLYVNTSGGSRNHYWNVVPSGSSPGASNQIVQTGAAGNNTRFGTAFTGCLSAGDFISINTDATTDTQMAWCNVMEIT